MRGCSVAMRASMGLMLLAASSCGSGGDGASPTTASSTGPTTTATTPATPATTTTSTSSTTTSTTAVPAPWTLRTDGLGPLTFGDSADASIAALTARLGVPTHDSVNVECGAGAHRIVTWTRTHALFSTPEDELVGYVWYESEGATEAGVKVGATLAELQEAYPDVDIRTDSLAPEWVVGEDFHDFLAGFLTGTDPSATVTAIYTGVTCFFR